MMQHKTLLPILAFITLLIISCNLMSDKKGDNTLNESVTRPKGVLLSNIVVHAFSDPILKDTFKLFLKGDSIVSGKVIFQIISHNNKRIHAESFPAFDLLGDDYQDSALKLKTDTITRRFNDFFAENNFVVPATSLADSSFDLENMKGKDWNDIKSDKTAVGFIYSHFYEGAVGIAYSKKRKKVVTYFESD
jgi:hypothetical protein